MGIETTSTKLSLPVFIAIAEAMDVQTDELLHDSPHAAKAGLKQEIAEILDACAGGCHKGCKDFNG